jgi:hypothetical protein
MATKLSINLKDPLAANQDLIDKKLIGLNSTQFPRSAKLATVHERSGCGRTWMRSQSVS